MVDLGTFGNHGILDLDKITDAGVFGQFRTGAQARVGANNCTARDMAALKMRKGADRGTGFNRDTGAEHHIGFNHRIAADHRVIGEIDGFRRDQRDAIVKGCHPRGVLEQGFGLCQFKPRIDAQCFSLCTFDDGGGQPARPRDGDDIGQVIFARRIGIADSGDQIEQGRGIGGDDTRIAQGHGAFIVCRILIFDDPVKLATLQDQAAIACRLFRLEPQDHDVMGLAGLDHRFQRIGADERRITIKHQRIADKIRQRRLRLRHRMARAQLFGLHHDRHIGIMGQSGLFDLCGLIPRQNHAAHGVQHHRGLHRMHQHRRARDRVQHLGQVRIHPRAKPRAKNNHCVCHLCPIHCYLRSTGLFDYHKGRGFTSVYSALQMAAPQHERPPMRSVIFDLDGTLADTSGDLIAAANTCFRDLGLGDMLDPATDAATALCGGRAMLRLGFSRLQAIDEAEVDRQYPLLLAAYAQAIDIHTVLYPGAIEAVEALKSSGYAVGIATNKPAALAETLMRSLGVRDHFASLIGADTLKVRKPDPLHHIEAVLRAGGDPAQSLLVGDTITDRDTARNAGVPSVLVTFGPGRDSVLALDADATLDDFADLPAVVARLIG